MGTRRIEAIRTLTGGKKLDVGHVESKAEEYHGVKVSEVCSVQFLRENQCVGEDVIEKVVYMTRSGNCSAAATVRWSLHLYALHADGTARVVVGKEVYLAEVTFAAEQHITFVRVPRPIAPAGYSDKYFAVRLTGGTTPNVHIGSTSTTTFTVVPAQASARIVFFTDHLEVQGTSEKQTVDLVAYRLGGCSGTVTCKYRTEKMTAVPGFDYVEMDGTMEFGPGVTEQVLTVTILSKGAYENSDQFLMILEQIEGDAHFDANDDGGEEAAILTVTVKAREQEKSFTGTVMRNLDKWLNADELKAGSEGWIEQFFAAVYCNGSPDAQAVASNSEWFFHILCLPWKVVFAFVPPTSYCGGWLCFFSSLVFIAIVTAIIGDLAELFGCVLEVPDSVTAITFVALGTSMPDLFASRSAACQDPWADASICNVTGSNSVNVFLGLGFPWTVAALYWASEPYSEEWYLKYESIIVEAGLQEGKMAFIVPAGSFIFNVVLFCCCAVVAFVLLMYRRRHLGVELGGPRKPKMAVGATFVMLWVTYILLASVYAQAIETDASASPADFLWLIVAMASLCALCAGSAVWFTLEERHWQAHIEEPPSCEDRGQPVTRGVSLEELMKSSISNEANDIAAQYGGWSEPSKANVQNPPVPTDQPVPLEPAGVVALVEAGAPPEGGNGHAIVAVSSAAFAAPPKSVTDLVAYLEAAKNSSTVVNAPNATHEVATLAQHQQGAWESCVKRDASRKEQEVQLRLPAGQSPAGGKVKDRAPLIGPVKHVEVRSKTTLLML